MNLYSLVNHLDLLVGMFITRVHISQNKTLLLFEGCNRSETFVAYGDCCSSSWIEHISGVSNIINQVVKESIELDLSSQNHVIDDGYNHITVYGYRLVTDSGFFEIEMRNSSNGYYGGRLKKVRVHKDDFWDFELPPSILPDLYPLQEDF